MNKTFEYLFGPVPSRRLGRSLGVDLIPFKTCTMDCSYCQLGETSCSVSTRGNYVPMQDVLRELDQWLEQDGQADHITLAGSGEPTLHNHFGDVFRWAKEHTDIQTVLLTNGTLLHNAKVRDEAVLADKVKVTLSAWDEESFRQIHRPAEGVNFDLLVKGEQAFRHAYLGELSVEVFIIDGVNSQFDHVKKIAEVVKSISPDRIEINTAIRPPADSSVKACPEERLQAIAEMFGPNASVMPAFQKQGFQSLEISEEALAGLVRRHPATCRQLADEFNLPQDRMFKTLKQLVSAGLLSEEKREGEGYFYCR
ncbi:radical SAM protein [Pontiella sp.]|uniref:radical SAM protein n=1 Tax=Pontiella sp. TaxID=2837462 RepID=UPI00356871E8